MSLVYKPVVATLEYVNGASFILLHGPYLLCACHVYSHVKLQQLNTEYQRLQERHEVAQDNAFKDLCAKVLLCSALSVDSYVCTM